MSEIALLQATDRSRDLPFGLRAKAITTLMQIPQDVADLVRAEDPRTLPARAAEDAFAVLMGVEALSPKPAPQATQAWPQATERPPGVIPLDASRSRKRRRPRPLVMRILAASMALAVPAGAFIVGTRFATVAPKVPGIAIPVYGPVSEENNFRGGRVASPAQPQAEPPSTRGRARVLGHRVTRPDPPPEPTKPVVPPPTDIVTAVNDVVKAATELVCEVTSTVGAILAPDAPSSCAAAEKSLPLLGSSG